MDMYSLLFSVAIKLRDSHSRAIRSIHETSEGTCISFISFPCWRSLITLHRAELVSVVGWQMKIKPWWYWTFPAEPARSGFISLHPTWLLHFSREQKLWWMINGFICVWMRRYEISNNAQQMEWKLKLSMGLIYYIWFFCSTKILYEIRLSAIQVAIRTS